MKAAGQLSAPISDVRGIPKQSKKQTLADLAAHGSEVLGDLHDDGALLLKEILNRENIA